MLKQLQYKYLYVVLLSIFLSFLFISCSSDGANNQGELFIKVVDAPANYQQINIVVDRVSIHQTGAPTDIGWTYLNIASSISFDLLKQLNGHYIQIASKVPAGTYDQIKIDYGACTIKTEGIVQQQNLNLDPSIRNGNTIFCGFQIVDGQQFQLTFDYDAYSSVYVSGVTFNNYYFKPKIRIQNTLQSGSITGTVRDSNNVVASAKITTFAGLDTITTYNDTTYGSFRLPDLPEGTYTVIVIPYNHLLMNDTLPGNVVIRQTATDLGIVRLKFK
jgi:hypothetical protein